jgi:hypothetical protein
MNSIRRTFLQLVLGIGCLSIVAASALAAEITGTIDSLTEIAPPASLLQGALEDTSTAIVFREQREFLLTSDLSVDAINPGAEVNASGVGGTVGTIPAGTLVDSFLVHYDPVGEPTDLNVTVAWSLIFRDIDNILGLIYSDSRLDSSDYLGAAGTTYPTGISFRGTTGNLEGNDSLLWSQFFVVSGLQSVTVEVDQIRVIVAVPEPASIALFTAGILAIAALRRRRAINF